MLITRLLLAAVFIPMLIEARLAASNERAQLARGGLEAPRDVYPIMRIAYPAVFLAMIVEGYWRDSVFVPFVWSIAGFVSFVFAGFVIFVAAKAAKWWAIASLGNAWTFRVIVRPGAPLVTTGPYRWLRHPNYVAVVGELVAVALMSGARIAGPVGTLVFGLLMFKRIAVEERALAASGR
jgi:methyltransferase